MIGYNAKGKPIRKTRTCGSRKQAREAVKYLQAKWEGRTVSESPTIGEFRKLWIQECESRNLSPNTVQIYDLLTKNHILHRVGENTRVCDLRPVDVLTIVADMISDGVGTSTIRHSVKAARLMFTRAIELGMLNKNPFSQVKLPKHVPEEIRPFTLEESQRILDYGMNNSYPGFWQLAFQTGMRIGELTGLHWSEVDFDKSEVRVKQQLLYGRERVLREPKSASGKRTISVSPAVLDALNEQRKRNMRNGNGNDSFVFMAPEGGPVWVQTFYKCHWNPMLKELGIDHRGVHHIRHTYATLAISNGVPITTVAQILGHSQRINHPVNLRSCNPARATTINRSNEETIRMNVYH